MKYYAVIDTNVLVSALLSKNDMSPTVKVLNSLFNGKIVPLYHHDIIDEYNEVLRRKKFKFEEETVQIVVNYIKQVGLEIFPEPTGEIFDDMDDLIFYEVAMDKQDSDVYLITGNIKHYPVKQFIVTPKEMMDIIEKH